MSRAPLAVIALGLGLLIAGCTSGGGGGSAPAAATTPGGAAGGGAGSAGTAPALAPAKSKASVVVARAGEGFLELNQGKLFLHVKGTPREMGEQYGELLGARIEQLVMQMPRFLQTQNMPGYLFPGIANLSAAIFEPYYPSDVKEYMDGIIAGNRRRNPASFLMREDLIFLTSVVDLGGITDGLITCSSVAVWGDLSKDGKMFQTRVVDLFVGSGVEDHAVVVIEKRDGKTPWANAGWAGMLGGISGMNAHGIGIGQVWAFSNDRAFGRPWGLNTRRIMEDGVNADDAVRELLGERHRTYGANFVFGDRGDGRGGQPRAYALESSANYIAGPFADADPREDLALWNGPNGPECYAIKIPFAVFRGDCCLDPGMRSRQTASSGPSGDPRAAGAYQKRYKGQADRVVAYQTAGVKIGPPELIALTQGVTIPGSSLQCCVYGNSDLELWVADARRDPQAGSIDAKDEPYVHFDFDYYLPTVEASLDRAVYLPGETQQVTLATSTMGSDRDLWLSIEIEAPGGVAMTHAQTSGPIAIAFRAGAPLVQTLVLDLPGGIPPGSYRLVAQLTERGTSDLVDVSIASFTVQ